MTSALSGKVAVVSGVTSGIGRATAAGLVAAGAQVIGVARSASKLAALAGEWGENFQPFVADLGLPLERRHFADRLVQRAQPIDIFVSNAAECVYESALELGSGELAHLFEVNVLSSVELCAAIVPLMPAGGHVLQLSSVVAEFMPNARFGPYAASKAAIEQFTRALRLELHPRRIRVSLVRPGLVDTPIYDKVEGFDATRAKLNQQISTWLSAEDVAQAILWVLGRPPHVAVSELDILPTEQTR